MMSAWGWQVAGVVLVTAILALSGRTIIGHLVLRAERTRSVWDDAALAAASKPLPVLVWVLGLNVASVIIAKETQSTLFAYASDVREILLVVILAWFLLRFVKGVESEYLKSEHERDRFDATTAHAIAKLMKPTILITASLIVMQKLGYSISGVLAFGGIGGMAVGFAAKDLLANFFGGLMIYLDRPFNVGEWIRSPDRNIEGTVEHIGWRLTRIRTFDKRPLYVPNATFTSIAVENPSRMTNRRIHETIGLRYDDWKKVELILADVREMLRQHPDIDATQTLIVNFDKFAESSLDFFIYGFTKTCDWVMFHQVKEQVLLNVMKIIDSHGAEIAFPSRTLHVVAPEEAVNPPQQGVAHV